MPTIWGYDSWYISLIFTRFVYTELSKNKAKITSILCSISHFFTQFQTSRNSRSKQAAELVYDHLQILDFVLRKYDK